MQKRQLGLAADRTVLAHALGQNGISCIVLCSWARSDILNTDTATYRYGW
jgi:hypothetical protein